MYDQVQNVLLLVDTTYFFKANRDISVTANKDDITLIISTW